MRPNPIVLYPPLLDGDDIEDAIHDSSAIVSDEDDSEPFSSDLYRVQHSSIRLHPSCSGSSDSAPLPPTSSEISESSSNHRRRLASNFEQLKKRKRDQTEANSHHVQLALETAQLVGLEIARMQRAVAELESLLDDDDNDEALEESP